MADREYEAMKDGMLAQLEGQKMAGLALDDLRDAMSHPKAAETVQALLPYEATAPGEGDAAPDFTLPRLAGHAAGDERITLSDHFGSRPVALIFGSYT